MSNARDRRALIARYRGTALGFLWTFLHPLLLLSVYALVFGVFVRLEPPAGAPHYAAFLVTGLLPWTWLGQAVAIGSSSILADAPLVKQAAFPAAVPPLVTCLATLVNFALAVPIVVAILLALGVRPTPWLLALPAVVAAQLLLCLGLTLGLAALSVRFRDTVQLVQAVLPVWFFLTPVIYPAELVPDRFGWLLWANPAAPLVRAYQDAFLGRPLDPVGLGVAAGVGLAACVVGAAVLESLRDRIPEEL